MTRGTTSDNLAPNTVGIVGAGRLGSSLAQAMAATGYTVVAASTRRPNHANHLRQRLPGTTVSSSARQVVKAADAIFITVDDASIGQVCDSLIWRKGQTVIHCSGAQPISLLGKAEAHGAAIGGFHPLQTFPGPDEPHRFQGITFGLESPREPTYAWLKRLAHRLGGETVPLSESVRAAYHASAVMACGLLAGLMGLSAEMWEVLGFDRRNALERLMPLVVSTVEGVRSSGLPAALTGPYVRGDVETIRAHLQAAGAASSNTGAAYAALALAALPIAVEQGGLSGPARTEIERRLYEAIGSWKAAELTPTE